jgi:hypothetical protein
VLGDGSARGTGEHALPPKQRVLKPSEQRGRARINFDATRVLQRSLREPATEHADGRDLRFAGSFRIVGGIPYRHGVAAFYSEFLGNYLEDIRCRFGFLGVFGRRLHVDQVGDPHARQRAFDIARQDPPAGVSPEAAAVAIAEVLDGIGDTCPECP